jgi:cytochrome c oxidase accessory protein FixG
MRPRARGRGAVDVIHARAVEGRFRTLRHAANVLLIAVLLGIPWIRVAGEPLVRLDVPGRKFHVAGLVIFPQELYFLWLILAGLALTLFFVTAVLGRVWCGWACPQTVFTDVFAAIGRRIQAWPGPRRPAHVAAWRRVLTHTVWIGLSAVVAFHLVGYFVPPPELLDRLARAELASPAMGFFGAAALLTYLDLGIVRQTFCKYLCPYARFQSVLFDADTLVIGYDARRGEPRGKLHHVAGDCVDCGLCVQVCPSDIDIRDGLQLECIACTQCIDACSAVMAHVGRPPDLIGYRSLVGLEGERPARIVRPRVVVYGALLLAVFVAFAGLLGTRQPMDLTVAHNREALVTRVADGRLSNSFVLRVENRARETRSFWIRLEDGADRYELVAGMNPITVAPTSSTEARVFVLERAGGDADASDELRFVLEPVDEPGGGVVRRAHFLVSGGGSGR